MNAHTIDPHNERHRGMITVCIMLGTVMQVLDSTIANVALPHMAGSLSASQDQITWVLTSYIVAAAIATPPVGWLTGRYGWKRVFMASIAGFTVASVFCGISGNLGEMVLARIVQGVFGAALVPLSQSMMLDINPPEKHGQAMSIWGAGVMVGPILGPALGGYLTDHFNWRWVFFINVPLGLLAWVGVLTYVKQEALSKLARFDMFGFVMLGLAVGLLQLSLDRGQELDWWNSLEIRIEMLGALMAATFFWVHTATAGPGSFFDTRLLGDRNFVSSLVLIFLMGMLLYGTRALLPPMLQNLMNYPVTDAGLVTAPSGLGTMISMLFAGRLVNRVGVRPLLFCGFGLTVLSLWQMAGYNLAMGFGPVVWSNLIQGAGLGFITVPLTTAAFFTLDPALRAEGTSIYSLSRNLGSSIGISWMETLLTRNTAAAHSSLVEHITPYSAQVAQLPGPLSMSSAAGPGLLNAEITRQASMIGYVDDFKLMMLMTVATVPLILLMRMKRRGRPVDEEETLHIALE